MGEQRIRVTIPRTGLATDQRKIGIEAIGFHGEGCSLAAKRVSDMLGDAEQEELKDEYYQTQTIDGTTVENG